MLLENIPHELRTYQQWVCHDASKRPLNPHTGQFASVTDPQTWGSFDQACACISAGYGIGFVLTESDPYSFIDLDVREGEQPTDEQKAILNEFDSYAEYSPGGRGVHIIVIGKVSTVKRQGIEIYSSRRYMTVTGNVIRKAPITDQNANLQNLWARLGGNALQSKHASPDGSQTASDEEIFNRAIKAENGAKLWALWNGDGSVLNGSDKSGSAIDMALLDIIAFYTDNKAQVERIWLASPHGKRKKTQERFDYRRESIEKAFDRKLPLVDISPLVQAIGQKLGFITPETKSLIFAPISTQEWTHSRISPDVIVDRYLFADVAVLNAAGGIGKTTLICYESICIVLGIDLYGRTIRKPGKVVIITAEDSREIMVARLARIASEMRLFPEQTEFIKNNIMIEYVGGEDFRLCNIVGDVVSNSPQVDKLIEAIKPLRPSLLVIDPAISFGIGESRVNDAEQGLIRASRRIRDALNCCVRLVHHTGKQNAREGAIDQYAGRGGSAMPDGARMVAVLKPMTHEEWHKETGEALSQGAHGLLLALPKLTYDAPQPHVYIERKGFSYRHISPIVQTLEDKCTILDSKVIEFLRSEASRGIFHSKSSLEQSETIGLSRKELRSAIERLNVTGRITFTAVPGPGHGQRIRVIEYAPVNPASNAPSFTPEVFL